MTRDECLAVLERAPRTLRSDELHAAVLATLLRIEAQGMARAEPKPAAPAKPRRTRKKAAA